MQIKVLGNGVAVGEAAAKHAVQSLRGVLSTSDTARIIAATGAAQFEFLKALSSTPGIDWQRVEMFHLDEYIGLPANHPASFCNYLLDRLIRPAGIKNYHLLDGTQDSKTVIQRVGEELKSRPVDVAFVGIGENGHLAFNDPPADFETEEPFLIVALDEACRRQQMGEGWFPTFADVPTHAMSMSIKQVLKAKEIIAIVPEMRKARAVEACLEGDISPMAPASILRTHPNTTVYLDTESASLLSNRATHSA